MKAQVARQRSNNQSCQKDAPTFQDQQETPAKTNQIFENEAGPSVLEQGSSKINSVSLEQEAGSLVMETDQSEYEAGPSRMDVSSTTTLQLSSSENESDLTANSSTITVDQMASDFRLKTIPTGKGRKSSIEKTRKRIRNEKEWKINIRKEARNKGLPYTTRKGKDVDRRTFDREYDCKCRMKCCTKLSDQDKNLIFTNFWNEMDWNAQTRFLVSSVWLIPVKNRKVGTSAGRTYSRKFYLSKIRVCKKMFLSILGIKNKRLDYALRVKRIPGTQLSTQDMRGKKSLELKHQKT